MTGGMSGSNNQINAARATTHLNNGGSKMKRMKMLSAAAAATVFALSLGLAACDSASPDSEVSAGLDESPGELATVLVADLGLSGEQQQYIAAMLAQFGSDGWREPGFLWTVAADLQERLTDEQKQKLFEKAAAGPQQGSGQHSRRGQQGAFGFGPNMTGDPSGPGQGFRQHRRSGGGFGPLDEILTDEQKAQVQEIRESVREELEAMKAALDAGEITAEEARDKAQAIRESVRDQIEALLTDDQKAQLENLRAERQAEREAHMGEAREVRNDVLGLTDEQIEAFDTVTEANREAAEQLREQVRNGDLTREDAHAAMLELRDGRYEQLADMLDDTQLEIVQIHDALAMRMRHHGMRGAGSGSGHGQGFSQFGSGTPFGGGFGFGSRG
jgi:hypothetical protein